MKHFHHIRHHWAPYWLTCNVCDHKHLPDYVLKIETLEEDIESIFENEFGFHGDDYLFPKVKTLGIESSSAGKVNSSMFLFKYFSQLSKVEIMKLYEMYKMDFQLFNYSPEKFLLLAQ